MTNRTFSPEALRAIRQKRGFTSRKLAATIGRSVTIVSLLERGHRQPSVPVLISLADALQVPLDDLVR